jgi:ParB family chromosome partitioning protein
MIQSEHRRQSREIVKKKRKYRIMPSVMQEIRRKLPLLPKKDASNTDSPLQSPPASLGTVYQLPIDDIIPNRSQPRNYFNQNAILRLADSIRRYGILQPLTVRKILVPAQNRRNYLPIDAEVPADATYLPPAPAPKEFSGATARQNEQPPVVLYELIAGERRLRAAKHAELTHVPCIIINTDDSTSAELAIIENLLREDLNMFEQAEAFRRLIDEFMLTQDEVARRVSLSQSAVANKLRILRLSREERQLILQNGLTERHARALLKIDQESLRQQVLAQIIENKWNVSRAEAYIDQILDDFERKAARTSVSSGSTEQKPPQHAELSQNSIKKGAIRDLQLFYNSIKNAANILEQAGVRVLIEESNQEGIATYIIRIAPRSSIF